MTRKQAKLIMDDNKDLVCKLLDELNGESFVDAMNILGAVAFFLKENSYVDAELAKSRILEGDSDE